MAGELQHLVDATGRRLDRSVAIDDAQIRLLAYNSHDSAVDSVRMNSVLQRNVSREIVDFIYASGGRKALDLFTVPVNEELGLTLGRVGMPIRYRNALLGFVWLLISEGEVDEDQAEVLRHTADAAAMILHREQLLDELSRSRERELTRDVLSGERSLREDAASRLADEGLMVAGPAVAVTMLLRPVDRSTLTERDRLSVAVGVDQLRRRLPRNSAIQLDR
ncbi:MAG: CdaR family transcriptional regulator, partial [Rhodococcus sp. (in: high G+C Gram-positive bacteria)]